MARKLYGIEEGIRLYQADSDSAVDILVGAGIPDGVSGKQGDAAIGSLYIRQGTGELYQKVANAGAPADYELNGASSATVGTWRPEKIRAVSSDTGVTPGVARDLTASPFTDDEGTALAAGDFTVGEFAIINDVLLEVTAVSAPNVTFSTPASAPALAEGDTFIAINYLPDSPGDQEGQAIVNYNGTNIVKIGDIDWSFADGINIAAGYAAAGGDVTASDTVQSAIAKLDGNNDAQDTLIGTAQGATDLGTFTGATIADSSTVKSALQQIETAYEETDANVDDLITLSGVAENAVDLGTFTGAVIADNSTVKSALQQLESKDEAQDVTITEIDGNVDDLITLSGVAENSTNLGTFTGYAATLLGAVSTVKAAFQSLGDFLSNLRSVEVTGVTTSTAVDQVPVATIGACKWYVLAFEEATPANREAFEVYAINDGTNTDYNEVSKLKMGTTGGNFINVSVDVSGGNMRLLATSSTAGITIRARRIAVEDV